MLRSQRISSHLFPNNSYYISLYFFFYFFNAVFIFIFICSLVLSKCYIIQDVMHACSLILSNNILKCSKKLYRNMLELRTYPMLQIIMAHILFMKQSTRRLKLLYSLKITLLIIILKYCNIIWLFINCYKIKGTLVISVINLLLIINRKKLRNSAST